MWPIKLLSTQKKLLLQKTFFLLHLLPFTSKIFRKAWMASKFIEAVNIKQLSNSYKSKTYFEIHGIPTLISKDLSDRKKRILSAFRAKRKLVVFNDDGFEFTEL